jgi:hypothetical protein
VWPFDLDLNFHVTNGRYLTMADVGRMDYVLKTAPYGAAPQGRAHRRRCLGQVPPRLRLFERFEIHTRMLGWDEKWLFVEHRFMSKGRVVGVVIMRGVFRSGRGRCRLSKSCATSACRNSRRHCRNGCNAGPTVATA